MQVVHRMGWEDRSVVYLARLYDNLNKGEKYYNLKAAKQIAFCDFTLFEDAPEFYSTYKIMNVNEPHQIYSDKLVISNVDLTRIDLATEEDKRYHLDVWAKLFKAITWEELAMLAYENPTIEKAISDVWQLTQDERVRERCLAEAEYESDERYKKMIEEENIVFREQIAQLTEEVRRLKEKLAELEQP